MCLDAHCQEKFDLQSNFTNVEAQIDLSSPSGKVLSEVFRFIKTNFNQPISLRDVAGAVGYSPAYLTDLVRRQTGQSVNNWILEFRLAEARRLLTVTECSIQQIARASGYQSANYFFRQFRRAHGITPQAWRDTIRAECSN